MAFLFREDIASKLLPVDNVSQIEGFFIKMNLKNKKKWLINSRP